MPAPAPPDVDRIDYLKGKIGGLRRFRPADDPELLATAQEIVTIRADQNIRRAVAEGPTFTAEQIRDLIRLLKTCGSVR